MEKWLKSQCNIYNYPAHTFKLSNTIKSLFKIRNCEKDNLRNCLIEENNNYNISRRTPAKKCNNKDKIHGNSEKIRSTNHEYNSANPIWRRFSLHSYRKRKQQKEEEKCKPVIAAVLRTYDKRGLQKEKSV